MNEWYVGTLRGTGWPIYSNDIWVASFASLEEAREVCNLYNRGDDTNKNMAEALQVVAVVLEHGHFEKPIVEGTLTLIRNALKAVV